MLSSAQRTIVTCLVGLAAALMLVGVVSDTIVRHLIQIVPSLVALGIVIRRGDWGACASIPVFAFWGAIVALIWLFLLGLSSIANGRYTAVEIVSTFLMAGFSIFGAVASVRNRGALGSVRSGLMVLAFGALQIVAMMVSFMRPFANR